MSLRTFLTIAALLALLFGLGFLLAPEALLANYGVDAGAGAVVMSRFFAVALTQLGLVLWLARGITDAFARRAIVLGGFLGSVVGLLVALWGQLSGLVNALGWSTVLIYLFLTAGYGAFAFRGR